MNAEQLSACADLLELLINHGCRICVQRKPGSVWTPITPERAKMIAQQFLQDMMKP